MTYTSALPEAADLPPELLEVAQRSPAMIDRRAGAALITQHLFPVSWRTVGGWDLDWEYPNGCAVAPPASYLAFAYRKSLSRRRSNPPSANAA
jgi:hypothetical protein